MPVNPLAVPHYMQEQSHTCVPACVRMALEYYSIVKSESALCKFLRCNSWTGTTAANISLICSEGIFVTYGPFDLSGLEDALKKDALPVIFLSGQLGYATVTAHAVLLVEVKRNYVSVNDPAYLQARARISSGDFLRAWAAAANLVAVIYR